MTTIYRKTAKGQAEIETRAHRLPPRARGALILVDGQRSSLDLAKLVPGDVEATLKQLLADGFIDIFAVLADRPPPPPSAPAPLATAPGALDAASGAPSINRIKREAARYLVDRMGPMAEGLAIRIERAKSAGDLQAALLQALPQLREISGAAAADAFQQRFIGRLP
jgi:hypothetical protein